MTASFDPDETSASHVLSVSELNFQLKTIVEGTFPPLWVAGEVTDMTRPRSGHLYFTLKDDESQIRAVMWRSVASRLPFQIENGQALLCFGGLEIYTVRGTYQIVVRKAQPQGVGTLQLAFEQLKAKLNAEGLFAAERKQTLPAYPQRIGLITSPSGAAVHDFLVAASNRMFGAEIFVIPAQVQGDGAAETIVRGLQAAAMIRPKLDVVVVTRGGGSLEDLWCFNEESVVRAIAACPLPTVSAIGHEIDITLADLAADVRALTPTDAAIKVFADRIGVTQRIEDLALRLDRAVHHAIDRRSQTLRSLACHPVFSKPMEMVHLRSRLADEWDNRGKQAIDRRLAQSKADVSRLAASLDALSPLSTLARGYSVTVDEDEQTLSDAARLRVGQQVKTILSNGSFQATVDRIDEGPSPSSHE